MKIDREIQRKLDKLQALENGGVDNWDGYDISLENWFKEGHVDDCIDDAIDNINDLMADAEVDEPSGQGAGYSVTFNEERMREILHKLIKDINNE